MLESSLNFTIRVPFGFSIHEVKYLIPSQIWRFMGGHREDKFDLKLFGSVYCRYLDTFKFPQPNLKSLCHFAEHFQDKKKKNALHAEYDSFL